MATTLLLACLGVLDLAPLIGFFTNLMNGKDLPVPMGARSNIFPGFVGILGAIVGWVAILVAENSMPVGLSVNVANIIPFERKAVNYGQVGMRGKVLVSSELVD